MKKQLAGLFVATSLLAGAGAFAAPAENPPPLKVDNATLRKQVIATERAFAASMANRDFEAFASFIAEEAIFDGLRGKQAVLAAWKPFFDGPQAPFSWGPDRVVVLDSGKLAQSGGPVFDPNGTITARFSSIWRRNGMGKWEIIFDKGEAYCTCKQPAQGDGVTLLE